MRAPPAVKRFAGEKKARAERAFTKRGVSLGFFVPAPSARGESRHLIGRILVFAGDFPCESGGSLSADAAAGLAVGLRERDAHHEHRALSR